MAVYTHISAEDMALIIAAYDVGELVSAKGIAEGVENSNYMVDTTKGRYFLTVYEKRVKGDDLPFFIALLDHLAEKGCAVPQTLHGRDGAQLRQWCGKFLALIEFLPGVSVSHPTPAQAHAVGLALGEMHRAAADFTMTRPNDLGLEDWFALAERCGHNLDSIQPGLKARVADECTYLRANWPHALPYAIVHGDLFPDNVLMMGDRVSGLIDFYFASTEIRAWDLAVTHAAWCFEADGTGYRSDLGDALLEGYGVSFGLEPDEQAAFNTLARGACLRFLLTRAWDWLNTPADALVTRKDPLAFLRRLDHYASQ
jgi:homoserine kinase type II